MRPAQDRDLLGVVRLLERQPGLPVSAVTERQRASWVAMLGHEGMCCWVAEVDAVVVGTVTAIVYPNLGYDQHPSALLEAMVVAESHRRRGVGRALLAAALADLQRQSCRKVQVVTHKRHATDGAHDFYRWMGFTAEAEGFRMYLGGGQGR